MSIELKEVKNKQTLLKFIRFPYTLYKNCTYYVPPLIKFEISSLTPKNPAFEISKVKLFLAIKNDEVVGRIAGIILDAEKKDKNLVRFGWIDFIDDQNVSAALINAVIDWAKNYGISGIHGPLGFTDLDFQGTLIEGFDELATQATIYNYPYYQSHFEIMGFNKACDWLERRGHLSGISKHRKKMTRVSSLIKTRFKLEIKKITSKAEVKKYAKPAFEIMNESFKDLYGFYKLNEQQIDYYTNLYFGFVKKEFIAVIVNEKNEMVAGALSLPSLSKALQKAHGNLYPFGFLHLIKAFQNNETIDVLLIGVTPKYQNSGATQLIFFELLSNFIKNKVVMVNTSIQLEDNLKATNQWNKFGIEVAIRRRCFIKLI
ncbi:MAG: hypothetical protein ACKVLJ_11485 [Cytophagales bacterium]|jgi:hypothetical protein|tara:strand:- start:739 stop:1857 length:1119 start_codon:yes stop_codon:yes gene_type:complete